MDLMKDLPDGSVDMVLCDLPYGTTRNKWDTVIPLAPLWEQYKRIVKENGAIVLFCDGLFMAPLMESQRSFWRYNLIWDKQRGCDFLNANRKPMKFHEEIAVFYKKAPTYNPQYWYSTPYKTAKNGPPSSNYGSRGSAASESIDGRRNPLSILAFARDGNRMHPTQKPVSLCSYLIRTYTNSGDTVLNNCMGSGTTGVSCVETGLDFIGIEKDPKIFAQARCRILDVAGEIFARGLKEAAP